MSRTHLERFWNWYWQPILRAFEAFAKSEYGARR